MEKKTKPEPINNTELVNEFRSGGGRVLHLQGSGGRAMTLAFVQRGGRVELATSVTHTNDCFTRKVGTKVAIEHFRAGKTVFLPLASRHSVTSQLAMAFGFIL